MDIAALKAELTTDPLARGYAGMTDAQAAASLNARNRPLSALVLSSAQVFNAIDAAEFNALTAAQKANVDRLLGLGADIDITSGTNARAVLENAFGAGSATRVALVALLANKLTRAGELGLAPLYADDVRQARLV